jgi:two-component system NarL family response regulator
VRKLQAIHCKQIRVIVADDHPVVREGLAAIIKSQPDMRVLCEAENGRVAVQQYFRRRPDVVLLDLRMPEMDGIAATRAILDKDPKAKVIVLSTYKGDEDVYQALKAGAKAYLLKDSSQTELMNCIRSVNKGQVSLSPSAALKLATGVSQERLTKREAQIMALVVAGKSNKEIGATLGVTEGTVKVHAGHVFRKLGASGRAEAIRIALERGVVHLPSL